MIVLTQELVLVTTPTEKLDVVGVVSATSFFGDGSNLSGITKVLHSPLVLGIRELYLPVLHLVR